MALNEQAVAKIFDQARKELYCPPCRLEVIRNRKPIWEKSRLEVQSSVSRGVIQVDADAISGSSHPEDYLIWSLRHNLGHAHYCPYDVRTAYQLQKAAYNVTGSRSLSFFTLMLFSDLQLDCVYLRNRFRATPYHLEQDFRRGKPSGVGRLFYSVYRLFYPRIMWHHVPFEYQTYAGLIAETIRSPRTWFTKVQVIAAVLRKLRERNPRLLKDVEVKRYNKLKGIRGLILQEDFSPNSARLVSSVLSDIKDPEEAESFYEQWVRPRIPREGTVRRSRGMLERLKNPSKGPGEGKGEKATEAREGVGSPEEETTRGGSESLPTNLGKRIAQHAGRREEEWKRYWYRARAEQAIIRYLADSSKMKPTWKILSYPDEWSVDDDIEALDLEASLDDGPIIPEVTTVKWQEQLMGFRQGPISGYVPSIIILLDSSRSMANSYDDASTAAYIAYLSGAWAGAETACISFSTDHLVADWSQDGETKEKVLASHLGGLTIMPAPEVSRLVQKVGAPCFVVVITDGGWQNIKEASPAMRGLGIQGHSVSIFHLKGWEYPDEVKLLRSDPQAGFFEVEVPERDLQGLVLVQAMGKYERHLR